VNEYYDIAALDSSRVDGAGERSARVTLLSQVLVACVVDARDLREMGLRAFILCERLVPGCLPKTGARLRKELRAVAVECWGLLRVGCDGAVGEVCEQVVEMVLGGCCEPLALGRRVSLLAYAYERGPEVRAALPSYEAIGKLWGLRARNPRSAVCAAMQVVVRGVVEKGQMRAVPDELGLTEFWFAKKRVTRRRCEVAQVGNANRKGHAAEDEDLPVCVREALRREHEELVHGVPVRAEFRGLSPLQLRRKLQGLAEEAERRRLGI
jgi:hypothetical protein